MGEYRRKKTVSTFLYSSWERGRVKLIFSPYIAGDMNYLMKQVPSLYVARNQSYIRRCLTFFNVWESIGEIKR